MKFFFIFVLLVIFNSTSLYSYDFFYETKFYKIDIDDDIISDGKKREIEKIKILSLYYILNNILIERDFNRIKKLIDSEHEVNFLIQNIIIENEFIKSNKYSSDIKINFDKKEIINLLRNNQIDYIDYKSPNYLVIVAENDKLIKEGLSENNSFYKYTFNQPGLINLKFPDLSTNDRFILPYKKIINKDIKSIKDMSNKYNTKHIFVILFNKLDNIFELNINLFTSPDLIVNIETIIINESSNFTNILYSYLNEWWKNNNLINNSSANIKSCSIKNANLYELNFINSKINLISQVKSNTLNQISLGFNTNDIVFYGEVENLVLKLSKYNIFLKLDKKENCLISTLK